MKLISIILSASFLLFSLPQQSCVNQANADTNTHKAEGMAWSSIEAAAQLSTQNDKKILVDIYTDWCKWCKVMDEKTFANEKVKEYLAANFNLAKLNAEQKSPIHFNDKLYGWVKTNRNGYNELANEILEGKMAYPSLAIFDSKLNKLKVVRGFKSAEELLALLEKVK